MPATTAPVGLPGHSAPVPPPTRAVRESRENGGGFQPPPTSATPRLPPSQTAVRANGVRATRVISHGPKPAVPGTFYSVPSILQDNSRRLHVSDARGYPSAPTMGSPGKQFNPGLGLTERLPNTEPKLRELFAKLQAKHGTVLVVVDQPASIGALPLAAARDMDRRPLPGRPAADQHRRRGHGPHRVPAAGPVRRDGTHLHRRTRRPRPRRRRSQPAATSAAPSPTPPTRSSTPGCSLRYLSDAPLRRRVTAATNKVEAFNGFSQWIGFGNGGVIADNDPIEQEKTTKFNALLTNAVIFHNALDIAEIVRQLQEEGREIDPEDLAHISPYLTEHINRFGEYCTHELGIQPEAYDPKLDVDFTPLREHGPGADGLGQAA